MGWCGIAWTGGKANEWPIIHFQLPESSMSQAEGRLAKLCGQARLESPPEEVAVVIARVKRHLRGEPQDFKDVKLDFGGAGEFPVAVYRHILTIPPGQTTTYGAIAKALNLPQGAQAVGQVLGRNPIPLLVPCHRVLAADGKPGGFSAPGGVATKSKLLRLEGVPQNLELEF